MPSACPSRGSGCIPAPEGVCIYHHIYPQRQVHLQTHTFLWPKQSWQVLMAAHSISLKCIKEVGVHHHQVVSWSKNAGYYGVQDKAALCLLQLTQLAPDSPESTRRSPWWSSAWGRWPWAGPASRETWQISRPIQSVPAVSSQNSLFSLLWDSCHRSPLPFS